MEISFGVRTWSLWDPFFSGVHFKPFIMTHHVNWIGKFWLIDVDCYYLGCYSFVGTSGSRYPHRNLSHSFMNHYIYIYIINLQVTFFCIVSGWCFGLADHHSICRSLSLEGASSPMSGAWTLGQRMAPRFTISSNLFCYLVIIWRRSITHRIHVWYIC